MSWHVDTIICLGDVASFGPQPDECVELLRSEAIPTVRGNSDDDMLNVPPLPDDASQRVLEIHSIIRWSRKRLSSDSLRWLSELPATYSVDAALCVHATPQSNREIAGENDAKPFPPNTPAVFAGHLHMPFIAGSSQGLWVNAGSTSRPTDGDPRGSFAVATRAGDNWTAEIVRFDLPLERICDQARVARLPHHEHWCVTQREARWW